MEDSLWHIIKICKEKKATPSHVKSAHGMSFSEYKRSIADEEFMKEVEGHRKAREERDSKEYHLSRILTYYWHPEAHSLTRAMRKFTDHARTSAEALRSEVDLSKYISLDEVVVGTVDIAEALTKDGWDCVLTKGGHDGTPKEYHMRRNE
jgi:hypothetical protein